MAQCLKTKNNNELISITFGGALSWAYPSPKATAYSKSDKYLPPFLSKYTVSYCAFLPNYAPAQQQH